MNSVNYFLLPVFYCIAVYAMGVDHSYITDIWHPSIFFEGIRLKQVFVFPYMITYTLEWSDSLSNLDLSKQKIIRSGLIYSQIVNYENKNWHTILFQCRFQTVFGHTVFLKLRIQ